MNYRVICRNKVAISLNTLAFLDMELSVQTAKVMDAVEQIFDQLSLAPETAGESRDGEERIVIVDPISMTYEFFEDTKTVMIHTMRHRRYRGVWQNHRILPTPANHLLHCPNESLPVLKT